MLIGTGVGETSNLVGARTMDHGCPWTEAGVGSEWLRRGLEISLLSVLAISNPRGRAVRFPGVCKRKSKSYAKIYTNVGIPRLSSN